MTSLSAEIGSEIAPLLAQHASAISDILGNNKIAQLIVQAQILHVDAQLPLDNIFVLRYLLSNKGNTDKSTIAIIQALEWRIQHSNILNQLDIDNSSVSHGKLVFSAPISQSAALSNDASHSPPCALDGLKRDMKIVEDHLCGGFLGMTTLHSNKGVKFQCPVVAARMKYYRHRDLMRGEKGHSKVSKEAIQLYIYMLSELAFRICDKETRKSGVLCKKIEVLDAEGYSPLTKQFDSGFLRIVGETSKVSEWLYPQLLGKRCFVNAPTALLAIMKIIRTFMSKGSVEKMGFCLSGKTYNSAKNPSNCPYVKKMNLTELLPIYLGGHAALPDSLNPELKGFK